MKMVRSASILTAVLAVLCGCSAVLANETGSNSGEILLVGSCGVNSSPGCGPSVGYAPAPAMMQRQAAPQYYQQEPVSMQAEPAFPVLRRAFAAPQQSAPAMGMRPLIAPRSAGAPHAVIAGPMGYGPGGPPGYGMPGGMGPMGYPGDTAYPKGHCAFPRLQKMFSPDQCFMSTSAPAEPMKTYTTRGPRDFFLNDKPSSIGY